MAEMDYLTNFKALGWSWNGEFHVMPGMCGSCWREYERCHCVWSRMRPSQWVNTPAQRYRWELRLWQIRRDKLLSWI